MQNFLAQMIGPMGPIDLELRKERALYDDGRKRVEQSLREKGGMEYYLVSKKWIRMWKQFINYYDDMEIDQGEKPPQMNKDLIVEEKVLFRYFPDDHPFNQGIKTLKNEWEYEILNEEVYKIFKDKYTGISIIRSGYFNEQNRKRMVYPNLAKVSIILRKQYSVIFQQPSNNQLQNGELNVDHNTTIGYWKQLIKQSIEMQIIIKIENIRLWHHRYSNYELETVQSQLIKFANKFDGVILDDNTFINSIPQNTCILIDLKFNKDWQFQQLDKKIASKEDYYTLLQRATNGCGRYSCQFEYCHKNPGFGAVQLSENEIKAVCINLLQDDQEIARNVCSKRDGEPLPLQMSELKKINKKNVFIDRMQQLTKSIDAFGASFVENQTNNEMYQVNEQNPQVDLESIEIIWKFIDEKPSFLQSLTKQKDDKSVPVQYIVQWVDNLFKKEKAITNYYQIRAIYIILQIGIFFDEIITKNICMVRVIASMNFEYKQLLAQWLTLLPTKQFGENVSSLKKNIIFELEIIRKQQIPFLDFEETNKIQNLLEIYKILHSSNLINKRISYKDFQIESIAKFYKYEAEKEEFLQFKYYRSQSWKYYHFTFCNYAFAIPTEFKNKLLNIESRICQQEKMRRAIYAYEFMANGQLPFLHLIVERQNIIETTLKQLSQTNVSLKMPLKIQFIGEQGVDEGGPKREFFSLLMQNLFNLDFGMFLPKNNETILWFNPQSLEMPIQYQLIGKLLGLALYNQVLLNLKFPTVIFKKLMNEPTNIEDLKEVDIDLYTGFMMLREYTKPDIEQSFCLFFQATYTVWGEIFYEDLKQNGYNIAVTQENKEEYIQLYTNWYLNKSIYRQFNLFKIGFDQVVDGDAIQLFCGEELQKLIVGLPNFDIEELEQVTKYDGYDPNSEYIKQFWGIIKALDLETQKRFLFFCTGSDRVPVGGMKSMKFIIQKHGEDTDQLPSAHTCFNVLLLPFYNTIESLKQKLMISLLNAEGFGLM